MLIMAGHIINSNGSGQGKRNGFRKERDPTDLRLPLSYDCLVLSCLVLRFTLNSNMTAHDCEGEGIQCKTKKGKAQDTTRRDKTKEDKIR